MDLEKVVDMEGKILVTGGTGAIGRNLIPLLRNKYGVDNVVVGYNNRIPTGYLAIGPIAKIDVTDKDELKKLIYGENITSIYHLAALLSVAAEKDPDAANRVNTQGLQNVLEVMRERTSNGVNMNGFWASSIAVYGKDIPSENVPENVILKPITVYGKGKVIGEKAIAKYSKTYGIDMRVIRFPGLNGPGKPGPGTTEYAIEMIQSAANNKDYTVPLYPDTLMPMMDMRDAVLGIIGLMSVDKNHIEVGKPYNISAFSFSPKELYALVKRLNPHFKVSYDPDPLKQKIADSWPNTIDDSRARNHWGWKSHYSLIDMVNNIYNEEKKLI